MTERERPKGIKVPDPESVKLTVTKNLLNFRMDAQIEGSQGWNDVIIEAFLLEDPDGWFEEEDDPRLVRLANPKKTNIEVRYIAELVRDGSKKERQAILRRFIRAKGELDDEIVNALLDYALAEEDNQALTLVVGHVQSKEIIKRLLQIEGLEEKLALAIRDIHVDEEQGVSEKLIAELAEVFPRRITDELRNKVEDDKEKE